jgi:chemotaxis protein CheX
MSGPDSLPLPARLDLTTAAELAEALRARLGADLSLDAQGVTHLGTPGLQVLLAARRSWAASAHALTVANAPDALADQLAQFGLTLADLAAEGPTETSYAQAENTEENET